jgi:hypothetical protein
LKENYRIYIRLSGSTEVQTGKRGTEPAGDDTFFCKNWNEDHEILTGFFVNNGIVSAVNRVDY